jgi:hypothetical protein
VGQVQEQEAPVAVKRTEVLDEPDEFRPDASGATGCSLRAMKTH